MPVLVWCVAQRALMRKQVERWQEAALFKPEGLQLKPSPQPPLTSPRVKTNESPPVLSSLHVHRPEEEVCVVKKTSLLFGVMGGLRAMAEGTRAWDAAANKHAHASHKHTPYIVVGAQLCEWTVEACLQRQHSTHSCHFTLKHSNTHTQLWWLLFVGLKCCHWWDLIAIERQIYCSHMCTWTHHLCTDAHKHRPNWCVVFIFMGKDEYVDILSLLQVQL